MLGELDEGRVKIVLLQGTSLGSRVAKGEGVGPTLVTNYINTRSTKDVFVV